MNGIDDSLTALVKTLSRLLQTRLTETTELGSFLALLAPLAENTQARPSTGAKADLPVVRHLSAVLARATGEARDLADEISKLRAALTYVQNPNYRAAPPSPAFLDNYGYAVFAGPSDGPPALIASPALAFGLLLLGPHTEYPPHHHPASEVYVPLGPAEWRLGDGDWRPEAPGAVIHHPPHVLHATRTGAAPLAALYLWRGDLATHARLRS